MKVRYISEGIFMNPTQARAARAKAQELSNVDKVSGTANKVIVDKVKNVLLKIITEKKLSPIKFSNLFSYKYSTWQETAYSLKRECDCDVDFSSGTPVIKLSFDFGGITGRPATSSVRPASSWITLNASGLDLEFPEYRNKETVSNSFCKKLKNAVKQLMTTATNNDKMIYQFILDNDIIIDKMYLYRDKGLIQKNEFTVNYPTQILYCNDRDILTKDGRNLIDGFVKTDYKKVIDDVLGIFDFGIPVSVSIPIVTRNKSSSHYTDAGSAMTLISDIFPGCETFHDMKTAAFSEGEDFEDSLLDIAAKSGTYNCIGADTTTGKRKNKEIETAKYISAYYLMIFEGHYFSNSGLKIDKETGPIIERLMITPDEIVKPQQTSTFVTYFYIQDCNAYVLGNDTGKTIKGIIWTNKPSSWGSKWYFEKDHDFKLLKKLKQFIENGISY